MKNISYSTPKRIQIDAHKDSHSIGGIKKFPCKKGKGEHQFVLVSSSRLFGWIMKEYRCPLCHKKKYVSKTV